MIISSHLIASVGIATLPPYRWFKTMFDHLGNLGSQVRRITTAVQSLLLIITFVLLSFAIAPTKAAFAQTATLNPQQVVEYALTLEKLEADFYLRANNAIQTGRINNAPPIAQAALVSYGQDEQQHVTDLSAVLRSLGGNPDAVTIPASPVYTAILGRDPFANLPDLLLALQYVEDLGAAAYKGQVQNLLAANADTILAGALEIHTVEARHAAGIRFLRQTLLGADIRPWIRSESEVIYNEVRSGLPIPFENEAFDGFATEDEVLKLVGPILAASPQSTGPAAETNTMMGNVTQQDCPAGTTLQFISGGFACMF
jgi:hypothetical protein